MKFNNLKQLLTTFSDENVCREYLIKQRWNGIPICPRCGCNKTYSIENGKRLKCSNNICHLKFSPTVGTIMENSKIPLSVWFAAIYLATAHKKGISSIQLGKDLGITQKTAWFVLHRIRELMRDKAPEVLLYEVQVDETYVGGKSKNKHANKRTENSQGRSTRDKTPVVGLYEKDGKVITTVVENTNAKTLHSIIRSNIDSEALVITDAYRAYRGTDKHHKHVVVKHEEGEYVKDHLYHTNNIENFWSMLKRGIYGIYHFTSKKHLSRYCDEFAYRYNTRKIFDNERFSLSLEQVEGRLTYKKLIAKR